MKKIISILIFAALLSTVECRAKSQVVETTVPVPQGTQFYRDGSMMRVIFTISATELNLNTNRSVLLTPTISDGNHTVTLPSIGVYGHQRWIYYLRNGRLMSNENEQSLKYWKGENEAQYDRTTEYEKWMDGAKLTILRHDYCCNNNIVGKGQADVAQYFAPIYFEPVPVYVRPKGNPVKTFELSGRAWIQFPVNRTEIYPERYNNPAELGKIRATIDSVRNDKDITISLIELKGFASPESPYAHNTELAKGRTESLRRYINNIYHFDTGVIATAYEPEDWAGLREYVDKSDIDNREQILEMIDMDIDPDVKEARIRKSFPKEYRYMLNEWYPQLRHTDYRIQYFIKSYTNPDEVRRLVAEAPQKLGINEFYIAAEHAESSEEVVAIWETAVRMFPEDRAANLNVATAALQRGDTAIAATYLLRAGEGAEVTYTRGVMAIMNDEYDEAEALLQEAESAGIEEATATLAQLQLIRLRGRAKTKEE